MEISTEQIKQIVENVNPSALNSDGLIEEGALDSLDIVTLVADFEEAVGASIDVSYITPENFSSIEAMAAFLKKAQGEN
ncbi:acyl carrier protein [Berryella intestinalis]|uniref:acyl carrier protein n=1 Tax=Berryella intestinalis TaxID=1531429 RepID=UPI000690B79E|nr:phosphopantetheine-binding protein [Berryella intestinalis]